MGNADADLVAALLEARGRPWTEYLKGAEETCPVAEDAAPGAGTRADASVCSAVYLWLTDMLGHPLGYRVRRAVVGGVAGEEDGLADGHSVAYRRLIARYADAFRRYATAGARIPLPVLNAFSKATLQLKRDWSWSIPCDAALNALAAHAPLIEIGGGTGHWAGLLQARGVDALCFDSSHEWDAKWNTWDRGDAAAVATAHGTVCRGGPEQLALHNDRTLVLMWPDFLGRGSFGTDCLSQYDGEFLILVGEWRDSTLGAYTEALPPTGQSFSAAFQEAVEAGWTRVERVALPNYPLYADSLMIYKRIVGPDAKQAPLYSVVESVDAGRYLVACPKAAADGIAPKTEILREIPLVKVTTSGRVSSRSQHVEMFEAACGGAAVSGAGAEADRVVEGLEAFYTGGLQSTGEGWDAVHAAIVESVVARHPEYADGGAMAHLLPQVVRVGGAFHYNGFGGVVDEESGALALRIFKTISLCNHSCGPNAVMKPNEGLLVSVAAIPAGAPVSISYLDDEQMLLPAAERRRILAGRWGFTCACARCAAGDDDLRLFTHLTGDADAAARVEFADGDGDVITLRMAEDGSVVYALNGEDRPPTRHLVLRSDGTLALEDIDREVEFPTDDTEQLERLRNLVAAAAVASEGILPSAAVVARGDDVRCRESGAAIAEAAAEALLAAEASAQALLAKDWGEGDYLTAARFALRNVGHHLSYRLLREYDSRRPGVPSIRAAMIRSAVAVASTWDAGVASISKLLADLHGDWAEALMRQDEGDHAADVYNAQHHYRTLNDPVDAAWANVAECQPNAEVLAFLFKD